MDQLNAITKTIDNTMQKVILANLTLGNLNAKTATLKDTAQGLKQNSTKLQERNVEGGQMFILSARFVFLFLYSKFTIQINYL